MTVATVTHGRQPVVAQQQLWQLAEQLGVVRQRL